ncbi:Mariner Mos1 transposase [Eumeta japonica]|uniref:Mariner Mos1 transposase n=1 Tax=Eumeta variegata TaxID=151549 RepID=A0A4C1WDC5_EUMVA|nr:Mariner Mos1 transposase [Eumeta japonica]
MRLSRALKRKRPQYYSRHDKIILLHDNGRPHVAVPVKNYLNTLDWETLPHPPYSQDVTTSDYHLFRSMAYALSGQSMLPDESKEASPKLVVVPQNIDAVQELIMQDHHVTYRVIKLSHKYHTAAETTLLLEDQKSEATGHPPNNPDFEPNDFYLLPSVNN